MPGGNKNIRPEDNTNGFQKNPQNIGKGRKKKIYTILKEKGYSRDDITTAFGELAFYTTKELRKIKDDETKPVITRIISNQFITALSKNDWSKIKEILEHVIGKPVQKVEQKNETVGDLTIIVDSEKHKEQIDNMLDAVD